MVPDVLAQEFRKLVEQRLEEIKSDMLFGGFHTFEAYREAVGKCQGLNEALDLIEVAFKRLDEFARGA